MLQLCVYDGINFCTCLSVFDLNFHISPLVLSPHAYGCLHSQNQILQSTERDESGQANLSDLLEAASILMPSFLRGPRLLLTSLSIRWAVSRVATSMQCGHPFSGECPDLRATIPDQTDLAYSAQAAIISD